MEAFGNNLNGAIAHLAEAEPGTEVSVEVRAVSTEAAALMAKIPSAPSFESSRDIVLTRFQQANIAVNIEEISNPNSLSGGVKMDVFRVTKQ